MRFFKIHLYNLKNNFIISVSVTSIHYYKLRHFSLQIPRDLVAWYQIYHQYVVGFLTHADLERQMVALLETPIILYKDEFRNHAIKNKILLYYILYSPKYESVLPKTFSIKRTKDDNIDLIEIFKELIDLIKNHHEHLPVKSIYIAIKNLIPADVCRKIFNKNVFTIEKYCQLIDISTATFKRAS